MLKVLLSVANSHFRLSPNLFERKLLKLYMNVKKVNRRNQYGETAVHRAAKAGNLARLTACLATPGVDINCRDNNGYTALHEAVQQVN